MAEPARHGVAEGMTLAGTYEITRLLGEGGMGAVWEARHTRLQGKKVAIKVLHAVVAGDAEAVKRFEREAQIASRLGHPNIVQVHDFNTLPSGAPYLILEYLEGESLAERLQRGPIPLPHAMAIARQIASALQAAHNEGIVHRDLKPHNVFLSPTESGGYAAELVKVLDFGISKIHGSDTVKTQTHAILGTPQYMSPEQARGAHDQVDARTDLFALGAIVYEMLTGRAAFAGGSIPEVMFKVVYEEPPRLGDMMPSLPPPVVQAVEHALLKDMDQRVASASAFIEALTGDPLITLRGGPATAAMPSPPVSPSLAAMAGQSQGGPAARSGGMPRATSPEAFAATMAPGAGGTGGVGPASTPPGQAPHASVATGPPQHGAHAPGQGFAATLASHASAGPAPAVSAQPSVPQALAGLAGLSDTAPDVDGPRRIHRRRVLPYVLGVGALVGGLVIVLVAVMPWGSPPGGAVAVQAGQVADQDVADTGDTDPAARTDDAVVAVNSDGDGDGDDTPGTGTPEQPDTARQPGRDGAGSDGAGDDGEGEGDTGAQDAPDPSGAADSPSPGARPRPRAPRDERIPADLKRELDAANALVQSDPGKAISRARATLGARRTQQAYFIMTRAYCIKGDLGNAKASFQHLRGPTRRRALQFCKQRELHLR